MWYEEILAVFEAKPTRRNLTWSAKCPVHEDTNPSLQLWIPKEMDKLLFGCYAGCSKEHILAAVGLKWSDMFQPKPDEEQARKKLRVVATYPYHDRNGKVIYEVVKYEPKRFAYKRYDKTTGRPIWNLDGVDRVLFRLPLILNSDGPVYVCEGEKDATRLESMSYVATCNPMGAGNNKWLDDYSRTLKGRDVVLIPDNDMPGYQHMINVLGSLLFFGASSVRFVRLDGIQPGEDISDWLNKIPKNLQKLEFDELVKRSALYVRMRKI